ncbi:hypothetical protein JCM5296_004248 [Sporobolomyces johnsonii]
MKLCVLGGNGLVGSAVARKAVARGWKVVSVSRSGRPFATPAGHAPAWVHQVEWRKGTPFDAASYASILPSCDALVSTLGILLESEYKEQGVPKPLSVLRSIAQHAIGSRGNPLAERGERTYERMNRDSAIEAFRAFRSSQPTSSLSSSPSPFVFISAEDIFRPFIPEGYIQSKRDAERTISEETLAEAGGRSGRAVRPVFVRPSLIYHPHLNPPSTLPATLLEASANLQALLPPSLRLSSLARTAARSPSSPSTLPPASSSLASLLTIPPIHADAVGEAVCRAIERPEVVGPLGVRQMRNLLDFDPIGNDEAAEAEARGSGSGSTAQ